MTDEELDELFNSPLFKESCILEKEGIETIYTSEGKPINGSREIVEVINNTPTVIIYNFTEGMLNDCDNTPAISAGSHIEYWTMGHPKKIIDYNLDVIEFWDNGRPSRIEKNVSQRLNNDESINGLL